MLNSSTESPGPLSFSPDRRYDMLAAVLIAVSVAVLWFRLVGVADAAGAAGWLGWDAYPILESTRLESASDVFDVATRRLAGEHLKAGFYRPLFALSVSAEQAFFGATPKTSLVINVLLFGGCLLAFWSWIASWDEAQDGAARPAGLVALVLLVLHPSVLDIVPYMPRRADLLCVLFLLIALRLDRVWLQTGRRAVLAGALMSALLATASKETAFALPVLVVASRILLPSGDLPRFRQLARTAGAYSAAVGILLIPRIFVLGGAGGYPDADRDVPFSPKAVPASLVELLVPHSGLESRTMAWVAVAILGLATLLGLGLARRGRRCPVLSPWLRLLAFSATWCLVLAFLFAIAGRVSPWYLFILGCGGFVGLGALSRRAWRGVRLGDRAERACGAIWLLGLLCLVVSWWSGSLFGGSTAELESAGQQVAHCVVQAERQCREAKPGTVVNIAGCPATVDGHGRSVAAIKPRTLAAWAQIEGLLCKTHPTSTPGRP